MILYHFSVERYAEAIRQNGLLSVAEKHRRGLYPEGYTSAPEQFEGEDELVWLTRDPNSNAGIQIVEAPVLVTVEAPTATRWLAAADRYGVPGWWRDILRKAALELSPNNSDRDWYVVEGLIPVEQVLSVEVLSRAA